MNPALDLRALLQLKPKLDGGDALLATAQWRKEDYMLTQHLVESAAKDKWRTRSSRVIMTNEARALRELRIARGLSMRKAGALIGVTDSYISHIENGRVDFPKGERLEKILAAYGGMKIKSFNEKANKWREKITVRDTLTELIGKISEDKVQFLLNIANSL